MKTVEKFCFCCDLELGTKIFAIIGIILSAVASISGFAGAGTQNSSLVGSQIAGGIIQLIVFIFLLLGTLQKRPAFVLPWVIVTAILIILGIIGVIVEFVSFLLDGQIGGAVGLLVAAIISYLIICYLWVCVYSYYKQLSP